MRLEEVIYANDQEQWAPGRIDEVHLVFSPFGQANFHTGVIGDSKYTNDQRMRFVVQCLLGLA